MIFPEKFPENQKFDNSKEKEFYFRFLNELPPDWDIYYSFKFYNPGLPVRELDYIIVSPIGIFIIELKNARFRYEDHSWQIYESRERKWKNHIKHFYSGPIEQVETAVDMFKEFLTVNNHLSLPCSSNSFIGVLFLNKNEYKQFQKKLISKENIVFHKELQRFSLFEILDTIYENKNIKPVSVLEREKIRSIILLNGNYYPTYPIRREKQKEVMVALTKEQLQFIEGLRVHPRMIINGVVGSGKTMMAHHAIELGVNNSWKCLYICSSENLKNYFQSSFTNTDLVKYYTFYEFRFLENISEVYDLIVIDEAQNIISGDLCDTIDSILKEGLNHGRWIVFSDIEQKSKPIESDFFKIISSYPHEQLSLSSNIRNPSEIFLIACLLGGKKYNLSKVPDALNIKFVSYSNNNEAFERLNEIIDYGIRQLKLSENEIIILSPYSYEDTPELKNINKHINTNSYIYDIVKYGSSTESKKISFSTIDQFQGLEKSMVILIGITNLDDPILKSQYYIALTRSTYAAGILFPKSSYSDLKDLINIGSNEIF